jgi:hypothetical protein
LPTPDAQNPKPRTRRSGDAELEDYRSLIEPAKRFRDGFGRSSIIGALFCGFLMVPGAIYLQLMIGQSMGPAATWVTVILFMEVGRRALKKFDQAQVVVLLMVAGTMVGGVGYFGELIWRSYLTTSQAAQDAGLAGRFPTWWIPPPDSPALTQRTFWHSDWLIPVGIMILLTVLGAVNAYCMGYLFFRLTSDVERLPYPMAPVDAAGTLALVEGESGESTTRWTVFSTGAMIGIGFGVINVLVPTVTGAIFDKPLTLLPLPWLELTPLTQAILPAVAFGMVLELGLLFVGMVLPFWAVMGTAAALLLTMLLNPVLYHVGVLHTWQPGMDTIDTMYANSIDFWWSAGMGVMLGLALVSIFQTVVSLRRARRERDTSAVRSSADDQKLPEGRGDFKLRYAIAIYCVNSLIILALCWFLLPGFRSRMWILVIIVFVYNPLISYVSARILGIAGQPVDMPFVKEGMIVLSGYRGADVWAAPIPISNYGHQAQQFRTMELLGVNFRSLIKAHVLTIPLVLVVSLIFWSYIWHADAIPSAMFPFAQKTWELNSRNTMLMFSATSAEAGGETMFEQAFNPTYMGVGAAVCVAAFGAMSWLQLPTMMIYGFVRGLGGIPHMFVLEIIGALIARFFLHKRFGKQNFLRAAPVLLAGYFTGIGLVGMLGAAIALIANAVSKGIF